jgi:hypothetical protein
MPQRSATVSYPSQAAAHRSGSGFLIDRSVLSAASASPLRRFDNPGDLRFTILFRGSSASSVAPTSASISTCSSAHHHHLGILTGYVVSMAAAATRSLFNLAVMTSSFVTEITVAASGSSCLLKAYDIGNLE